MKKIFDKTLQRWIFVPGDPQFFGYTPHELEAAAGLGEQGCGMNPTDVPDEGEHQITGNVCIDSGEPNVNMSQEEFEKLKEDAKFAKKSKMKNTCISEE